MSEVLGRAPAVGSTSLFVRLAIALCVYMLFVCMLRDIGARCGFEYFVNINVLWRILGPPKDVYSFRNLWIPRFIGLVFSDASSFTIGVAVFGATRLRSSWQLSVFCVTAVMIGAALAMLIHLNVTPESPHESSALYSFMYGVYSLGVALGACVFLWKHTH